MKTFGTSKIDKNYRRRPGSYGVLFNTENQVALVEVAHILVLPGGGIEPGETPETALYRELSEEIGVRPKDERFMCQTGEYMKVLGREEYVFIIAHLFYATDYQFVNSPTEEDHKLVWLDAQSAISDLYRLGHQWAVEEALRRIGN